MWKIFAVLTACAGAVMDFKTHKIRNKLTGNAMWIGLTAHFLLNGTGGMRDSFWGILTGSSFILLWMLGALKAGDVKLYMAIGAMGGWRFALSSMVYSVLIGGIAAVCVMIFRKNGRRSLKNLCTYGWNLFLTRKFHTYEGDEDSYFCFGICIAAGAICSCCSGGFIYR